MKSIWILRIAIILAGTSVLLGAFAAHSLTTYVSSSAVASFQKGVYYQFVHAIALMIVWLIYVKSVHVKWWVYTVYLFLTGIVCFSGSIYYNTFSKVLSGEDVNIALWVRLVTPLGGIAFLLAWVCFLIGTFRLKIKQN